MSAVYALVHVIIASCIFLPYVSIHHHCKHADLDYTLNQMDVNYVNHPYSEEMFNNERRQLAHSSNTIDLTSYSYSNIRITPYYDPVSISNSTLSAANIATIKQLTSSAIAFLSKFVKVIPIESPFYVPRFCESWYAISNTHTNQTYKNCISFRSTCLETTLPESHLDSAYLFDYTNDDISKLEKGNGMRNDCFSFVSI